MLKLISSVLSLLVWATVSSWAAGVQPVQSLWDGGVAPGGNIWTSTNGAYEYIQVSIWQEVLVRPNSVKIFIAKLKHDDCL